MNFEFSSRRSPVYATKGVVASSQPLASAAGIEILRNGGNAASAAVAVAASLNVTEPTSTGIGGDVFVLYYDHKTKKVFSLNGSGRAPANLSLDRLEKEGLTELPPYHPYTVTVPGACDAWFTLNEKFGNRPMNEVLSPAIELATKGFPVAPLTSYFWQAAAQRQLKFAKNGDQLLINGNAPQPGQIFKNPGLAKTFSLIAKEGREAFYQGIIGEAVVKVINESGGCLSLSDLENHHSDWVEPIAVEFNDAKIWECPPNGQGLAALIALKLFDEIKNNVDLSNQTQRLHWLIEVMKLAFSDAWAYISDPDFYQTPMDWLLSDEYAKERSKLINPTKANQTVEHGTPPATSDTVYFCVVDKEGNACSFINSNYMGFGAGIVPSGFGFSLQNRGHNFSLTKGHPNQLEPGKRPYHTIIPAMATNKDNNQLIGPFGVMGGFMQPQGHMQVAINLFEEHLDPQTSLDKPRFCILPENAANEVAIEEGFDFRTLSELSDMGHAVKPVSGMKRAIFGRGQIIIRNNEGVLSAGSDPRADGCALPLIF